MKGMAPGWQVRCPKCNFKIEAGRTGIIRLGAIGTSRTLGTCSRCNRWRWLIIEARTDAGAKTNPSEGFALGWRVRCTNCNKTIDAGTAGLIADERETGGAIIGPCSNCGKRQKLILERQPVGTLGASG